MLDKDKITAEKVIENLLSRGIDWFDYKARDEGFWRTYFNDAKSIATSDVFNNEINHYIADLMKFITYEADSFDKVLHTRTAIVTLETLKQRLLSIEDPTKSISIDNIYESI